MAVVGRWKGQPDAGQDSIYGARMAGIENRLWLKVDGGGLAEPVRLHSI